MCHRDPVSATVQSIKVSHDAPFWVNPPHHLSYTNLLYSITTRSQVTYHLFLATRWKHSPYCIALIFRGSLILRFSRIWNCSRNLFNENLNHCAVTPMGNTNSQNLFNEFLQSSYSRKFRPAKYKRYTVTICSSSSPGISAYCSPMLSP